MQTGRLHDCCKTVLEANRIKFPEWLFGLRKPDVMVPSASLRVQPSVFTYHVDTRPFPAGSFLDVGENLFVASPELCFLQMSEVLSVAGLVAVGLELCGRYRLLPEDGFIDNCVPATSPEKLKEYVRKSKGRRGCRQASRALRWVLSNSASPMESHTYERTCLSRMLGGWAAPFPVLNGFMRLNEEQQGLAERAKLYGDLYWPEQNVLLEYDGELAHTGRDKLNRDALRDNAIAARKTRRLTITADLYYDQKAFDGVMRELFRMLGVTTRKCSEEQLQLRRKLPMELRLQEALTRP